MVLYLCKQFSSSTWRVSSTGFRCPGDSPTLPWQQNIIILTLRFTLIKITFAHLLFQIDMARYKAENDQMCFLCFMSFCVFFFKLEKSKKEYCMIFAMRLSLGSAWAYAILWFPPTERASDTQCVFVFLCFFLPKNTKTHWPNVSLSFFNIRIAPDSLCVFVFLCFFPKNTKTHWPNVSLSFFNIRIAPDSLCVFVFLCFFPENTKTHWPIFFLLPNNKIAPESQCVFVFLCFFLRKAQKHIDKMFLCLFLTLWLHQTAYVFLCFCVFSEKHKNTLTQFCWK